MSQRSPSSFNIAILQIDHYTASKLEIYWNICDNEKISFLLLGEYVVDPFFKALQEASITDAVFLELLEISKHHTTALLVPMIRKEKDKFHKSLFIFKQGEYEYYDAQRLIAFDHWNEKNFFANATPKKMALPLTFDVNGLKVAIVFGFEVYFDDLWLKMKNAQVDVVFVSSVATFGSCGRWREILKSRAFLNSCYIARANRIGRYPFSDAESWEFYGDSLFISPSGEVESFLSDNEELLIAQIDPEMIMKHKEQWKFR